MNRTAHAVRILAPALMLGLALAACSTPESKVRSRLIGLGVSPPMAGCMADRMVDRLSYAQLRRLGELGGLAKHDVRDMRVGELLERTRAFQDPEVFSVVRSEERRVGKEWSSSCSYRWSPYHKKKK